MRSNLGWIVLCAPMIWAADLNVLRPGVAVVGQAGDHREYHLSLNSDRACEVELDQIGADIALAVRDPSGERMLLDLRESGPERFDIGGSGGGLYRLEVFPIKSFSGSRYRLMCKSLEPLSEAVRERMQAQLKASAGKALAGKGGTAQLQQAEKLYNESLEFWKRADDNWGTTVVTIQLAQVKHGLSDYAGASALFKQELASTRALNDPWAAGECWNNLGMTEWQQANIGEALNALHQSLQIYQELGYRYGQAVTLSNLGILYRETGSYSEARSRYREALRIAKSLGDQAGQAYLSSNLGVSEAALGLDEEALASLETALKLFRLTHQEVPAARTMLRIARIRLSAGKREVAAPMVAQALATLKRSGDRRSEADAEILLGRVAAGRREFVPAGEHFEKAISLFTPLGNTIGRAEALHAWGLATFETGDLERAQAQFEEALALRSAAGVRDAEVETLYQLARVEKARDRIDESRTHIDRALEIIETLRSWLAGPQMRMGYLAVRDDAYLLAIDIYRELARHHPQAGFEALALDISERNRARALLDLYSEPAAALDQATSKEFETVRRMVNYWSGRVADQATKEAPAAETANARQEVEHWITRLHELDEQARFRHARYAELTAQPLASDNIQRDVLDADTVLLEYSLGQSRGTLWAVTRNSLEMFDLPPAPVIEAAAESLNRQIQQGPNAAAWKAKAKKLSALLFNPARTSFTKRYVVIAADAGLREVPFGLLPIPDTGRPLMNHAETTVVSSASAVRVHREALRSRPPASRLLAIIADAVYDAGDPRVPEKARHPVRIGFSRLPFSRREAAALEAIATPPRTLKRVDFEANRDFVLRGGLEPFRFVHFSAHEDLNLKHAELSSLVLSQVSANGRSRDGFLRAHEIETLRLRADLVVLGGCRSGLGPRIRAEGVIGIARSFLQAGAARALVSLWDVDDEASAEFMRRFYQVMLGPRRMTPGAALRDTQLSMSADPEWQSPRNWAGWVMEGEWR